MVSHSVVVGHRLIASIINGSSAKLAGYVLSGIARVAARCSVWLRLSLNPRGRGTVVKEGIRLDDQGKVIKQSTKRSDEGQPTGKN